MRFCCWCYPAKSFIYSHPHVSDAALAVNSVHKNAHSFYGIQASDYPFNFFCDQITTNALLSDANSRRLCFGIFALALILVNIIAYIITAAILLSVPVFHVQRNDGNWVTALDPNTWRLLVDNYVWLHLHISLTASLENAVEYIWNENKTGWRPWDELDTTYVIELSLVLCFIWLIIIYFQRDQPAPHEHQNWLPFGKTSWCVGWCLQVCALVQRSCLVCYL